MSQEGARHRAGLWLRQADDDLRASQALLAADDRDLRSHSLTHLLLELGPEPAVRWQRQARVLDKLHAPIRDQDALGDDLPADVFGPEDAAAALEAATALINSAREALEASDEN